MLFWRTLQCQINIDAISGRYCIDIGNIIGSIYFSNIKPILQKTIFAECWVWISSQHWDCILAQYLVNNFAIGSIIFQGTPQYQVNIDPITTWYCLDIGIIIGSIYFSNIKPILQKTIFAECWVWISSQYWDCILAQYLVNKFCYLGRIDFIPSVYFLTDYELRYRILYFLETLWTAHAKIDWKIRIYSHWKWSTFYQITRSDQYIDTKS